MAEVVDSLANSLSLKYNVSIICPDSKGGIGRSLSTFKQYNENVSYAKFSNVNYYLIEIQSWHQELKKLLNTLEIDIFHNFAETYLISFFDTKPKKSIYTIDNVNKVVGSEIYLDSYDFITTVSESYAKEALLEDNRISNYLKNKDNFQGITNGVLTTLLDPSKGLYISSAYDSIYQNGKKICKNVFCNMYGLDKNKIIYFTMGRLVKDKNIDEIISVASQVAENNGIITILGKGDFKYESILNTLTKDQGIFYINKFASPIQAASLVSSADFYLNPSLYEPCGLMPMTASIYGAVPIVSKAGGLKDNFNKNNAIIIENNLSEAISVANELYNDKNALYDKRKICMSQDFSWATRQKKYIELYEE